MSKIIKNNAIINYNGQEIKTCDVSTVIEPGLEAHKRAYTSDYGIIEAENNETTVIGTVGNDRTIIYEIVLTNYSSKTFNNVVVTDRINIPAPNQTNFQLVDYNYNNSAELPDLMFTIPQLPGESTIIVRYAIELGESIPAGTVINNMATVDYNENPSENPVTTEGINITISYSDPTTIEATKTAPQSVLLGEVYTYEILFENTGKQTANVTSIEDKLPEDFELGDVKVYVNDALKTLGNDYTKDDTDNNLEITAIDNNLDIPEGGKLKVEISGKVT